MIPAARLAEYRALASLFSEGVFVPIVCYADESGTHDETGVHYGAEVATVGGLISWKQNWDTFTQQWLLTLHRYQVPEFHMADFVKEERCEAGAECTSPYHGWSREKREQFGYDLAPIIRDNTIFGVGAVLDVRAYEEIMTGRAKEAFGHPYHVCFQTFFDGLITSIERDARTPFPEGESIACFFDQQNQFGDQALQTFREMQKSEHVTKYLSGLDFVSMKRYVPLQAADFWAFRLRKVFTRILSGKGGVNPGSWDAVMGQRDNLMTYVVARDNLEQWAASGAQLAQVFRYARIVKG
jgi:hypothetical protein